MYNKTDNLEKTFYFVCFLWKLDPLLCSGLWNWRKLQLWHSTHNAPDMWI